MRLSIPERVASDVEVYVLDEAHAEPVTGDEEEATFLRGRAAIVAGWRPRARGAVLDLPAAPSGHSIVAATLRDVRDVFLSLANREDAAPASTDAYLRICTALSHAAEDADSAARTAAMNRLNPDTGRFGWEGP